MIPALADDLRADLCRLLEREFGLGFSPAKQRELDAGLRGTARALGFHDVMACARRLVHGPLGGSERRALATNFTDVPHFSPPI